MKELQLLNEAIIKQMLTGTKQASSCNLILGNDQTISGANQTCTQNQLEEGSLKGKFCQAVDKLN